MSGRAVEPGPTYPCPACAKRYKRREHLQRHAASHSAVRPYRCERCGSSHHRADVLRRHVQACQARAADVTRRLPCRRRACDRCVQQKKACDAEQPCQNCRRRSVACRYAFAETAEEADGKKGGGKGKANANANANANAKANANADADADIITTVGGDSFLLGDDDDGGLGSYASASDFVDACSTSSMSWLDFLSLSQTQPSSYRFHFLDHFTSRTGLVESFDCGDVAQRWQVLSAILQAEAESKATDLDAAASGPSSPSSQDPLLIKSHQILLRVKEAVTVKPRNSAVTLDWSASLEQRCLRFFSPPNLRKYLALYWAIWHPNVNIIHYPSFDPASSKSILIAAMALLGASISPDTADNEEGKPWFNCVEEMVFTDDDFCNDPLYTCGTTVLNPKTNKRKIQALQAAYVVCLYQNWEGTDASKRRIRRYRFSTLVSAARDIGFMSARHPDYGSIPQHELDWKDFVAREELIRTFLWIFLLDHAFVIFNNLPPRLVIKEMGMHLAFPEAPFQAATAEECARELHGLPLCPSPMRNITLREAVESLCRDAVRPCIHRALADLGPLSLFAIVSAFHSLIFHKQNSSGGDGHLQPIRNALDNWKSVWEIYSGELASSPPHVMVGLSGLTPENMWKRTGFMRHSPEYWLLASLLLDRLSSAHLPPRFDAAALNEDGATTADPILSEYDQTSMRQVNELIAEFQNVRIY